MYNLCAYNVMKTSLEINKKITKIESNQNCYLSYRRKKKIDFIVMCVFYDNSVPIHVWIEDLRLHWFHLTLPSPHPLD